MIRYKEHWLSKPKGEPRRGRFARCSLIGIALCLANISGFEKAHSVEPRTNHYRQWAFIQLNNIDEFYCLDSYINILNLYGTIGSMNNKLRIIYHNKE